MPRTQVNEYYYIVGIGASAGGLEALESFFEQMPPNNGMAFVVIQHLSPDYKSMMVEILSKRTSLKVFEATDEISVQPNCIYLIPPKKNITIHKRKLYLTEKNTHRNLMLPIDIFFHSLAQDQGRYAIAIVLSGTGSDGTRGIRSVKESDGMVMVQHEDTAKFNGMPRNAIATGLADFILPPEKMPEALLNFIQHPQLTQKTATGEVLLGDNTEEELIAKVLEVVKEHSDVNFANYKLNTMIRRIERRMGINQIHRLTDYFRYIQKNAQEVKILYKELLIGVTKFFRDTEAFESLSEQVIPKIFASKSLNDTIRIWVAGCSTGEEAYSLAILFSEYKEQIGSMVEIKIFATDVDTTAIDYAATGRYPDSIVAEVAMERLQRFFVIKSEDNKYEVSPKIRKMVIFSPHDLIKNPPFGKMDLISCRNLFIYLQPVLQEKILQFFHFSLKSQGYLFLGNSESISEDLNLFTCLDRKHKIYQYKTDYTSTHLPSLNLSNDSLSSVPRATSLPPLPRRRAQPNYDELLYETLAKKYLPPCVIIDENLEVLHFHGSLNHYLHLPHGRASLNLAKMLQDDIAIIFQTAIHTVMKNNQEVVYTLPAIPNRPNTRLRLETLKQLKKGIPNWYVVMFEEVQTVEVKMPDSFDLKENLDKRVSDLENELQYTRETLQATLEEVETSNEELQATNEELLASNEELQSTNEELQAVNEELVTVNAEHQHKIQELSDLNDDINNLLRSTNIGTIFLDKNLCIKRFTPAITKEFNLRESDLGRPLAHQSHLLKYESLLQDIEGVAVNHSLKKIQVQSKMGNWYVLQISPYIASDDTAQGVVVTLVNITEELEEQKRTLLAPIVESFGYAVFSEDAAGKIFAWNRGAEAILGYSAEEMKQRSFYTLVLPERQLEVKQLVTQVKAGEVVEEYKTVLLTKDQQPAPMSITMLRFEDPHQPNHYGISITGRDISEFEKLEEQSRAERGFQYELNQRLLELSPAGIVVLTLAGKYVLVNQRAQDFLGLSSKKLLSRHFMSTIQAILDEFGQPLAEECLPVNRILATHQAVSGVRLIIQKLDGSQVLLLVSGAPLFSGQGEMFRMVFYFETVAPG